MVGSLPSHLLLITTVTKEVDEAVHYYKGSSMIIRTPGTHKHLVIRKKTQDGSSNFGTSAIWSTNNAHIHIMERVD